MRYNKLGNDGWSAIFKALAENKGGRIESWDLSGEGIGPETAKILAEYVAVSSTLKTLKYAPCMTSHFVLRPMNTCTFLPLRSLLANNSLDDNTKQALQAAAGSIELILEDEEKYSDYSD